MKKTEEKSLKERIDDICIRLDFIVEKIQTVKSRHTLENPYALGNLIDVIDPFLMKDLSAIMEERPLIEEDYAKVNKTNILVEITRSGNQYRSASYNLEKKILTIMCPKVIN